MAWERKLMRTVRVRNINKPGTLARLLASIADLAASVGSIERFYTFSPINSFNIVPNRRTPSRITSGEE